MKKPKTVRSVQSGRNTRCFLSEATLRELRMRLQRGAGDRAAPKPTADLVCDAHSGSALSAIHVVADHLA
ncbi:hypothetical protein ACOY5P_17550 [Enterobacter asburiae]|uniref:hypothetical protein n=1 Tax=Enterobacterales TaxID=91347 RepID=UPI0013D92408|nr:hypothetical protein [Serratia marcescens]